MQQVVDHLIERGYRSVAYVSGSSGATQIIRHDALGRPHCASAVGDLPVVHRADDVDAAGVRVVAAKIRQIAARCRRVLRRQDGAAVDGRAACCRRAACPHDIGIVGFDDIPFAAHLQPEADDRLATCRRPRPRQRRVAADRCRARQASSDAVDACQPRRPRNHTRPGQPGVEEGHTLMTRKIYTRWPAVEGYADRQSYAAGRRRRGSLQQPRFQRHRRRCRGSAASVSRCGDARDCRSPSTPIRTTRTRPVADGRSASRSRSNASWPSGFYEVSLQAEGEDGRGVAIRGVLRRSSACIDVCRRHRGAVDQHLQRLQPVGRQVPLQRCRQDVVRSSVGARLPAPSVGSRRGPVRRPRQQPGRPARRGASPDAAVPRRLRLSDVVCVVGLAHLGAALRSLGGGRGDDARLRGQLRPRVPSRGARWSAADVQRRPRRVLVVEDARHRRRVRRRRRVVGDPVRQHLLLAGALRGRRSHDDRLQGPRRNDGSGCRYRRSTSADVDVVAAVDRPARGADDRSQLHARWVCTRRPSNAAQLPVAT